MRVLVTGSSGLIGSALTGRLESLGHEVVRLVRSPGPTGPLEVAWEPESGRLDPRTLEGLDSVVHLAGESIASGRWSAARKARIASSRLKGTSLLASAIASLKDPPSSLICASAIGYYGDRGQAPLTEDSPPGEGFLAEVCSAWEAAATPAAERGIRVAHVRIGVVLAARGGALSRMALLYRLGLGGRAGGGGQYLSWISLEDVVGALCRLLGDGGMSGAYNATAPSPVTNAEFARVLGRVLRRPALLHAPAFALRMALGEMAKELILASARVLPERLIEAGFVFRHPDVEDALRAALL